MNEKYVEESFWVIIELLEINTWNEKSQIGLKETENMIFGEFHFHIFFLLIYIQIGRDTRQFFYLNPSKK